MGSEIEMGGKEMEIGREMDWDKDGEGDRYVYCKWRNMKKIHSGPQSSVEKPTLTIRKVYSKLAHSTRALFKIKWA
jgi:hypothetical protein